ncbi:CG0192-related protein [Tomitella biformata]|uniref:CG0192-related protein n=1 Tax=Tomitella biformata TaxID=630403 RepID=UPI00046579F4|nr:hypothetical protein [Tomitella biformata]
MALIYDATLSLSKLEILQAWVPTQPWFNGAELTIVGAYRFDDPQDEVGMESHLVQSENRIYHVPLTYRGAPLEGAEASLITTMEHSVLGRRWVYDAVADPVYARALATSIRTGGRQADLEFATPVPDSARVVTTRVRGSGEPGTTVPRVDTVTCADDGPVTVITAGDQVLELIRAIDPARPAVGVHLAGTWPGQDQPAVLAALR